MRADLDTCCGQRPKMAKNQNWPVWVATRTQKIQGAAMRQHPHLIEQVARRLFAPPSDRLLTAHLLRFAPLFQAFLLVLPPGNILSRRPAGTGDQRLPRARAAARHGRTHRRRHRRMFGLHRRGGDRHRQDLRLSGAGPAFRRQGDRLHRHQDPAGPVVQQGSADGARRAEGAGQGRLVEGPRQLRLSLPPRTRAGRRPLPDSRGRRRRPPHFRVSPR